VEGSVAETKRILATLADRGIVGGLKIKPCYGEAAVKTKDAHRVPLPGSPEYQEYIDKQGQQAMDQALAMPLVRTICGLFSVVFGLFFLSLIVEPIIERDWRSLFSNAAFAAFAVVFLIDLGFICALGRSRTPWFRAIMRRYRAKS
jgi:hypothetical protein